MTNHEMEEDRMYCPQQEAQFKMQTAKHQNQTSIKIKILCKISTCIGIAKNVFQKISVVVRKS